jgi:hypothetical protein
MPALVVGVSSTVGGGVSAETSVGPGVLIMIGEDVDATGSVGRSGGNTVGLVGLAAGVAEPSTVDVLVAVTGNVWVAVLVNVAVSVAVRVGVGVFSIVIDPPCRKGSERFPEESANSAFVISKLVVPRASV